MIGLNQLRYGNLFQTKKRGRVKTFLGINPISQNLYFKDEFNKIIDYTNLEIEPIQITSKWLIMFGFNEYDQIGDNYFFTFTEDDPFYFNLCLNFNEISVSFYSLDWDRSFKINSVHQLQNLYFAITGTELGIK